MAVGGSPHGCARRCGPAGAGGSSADGVESAVADEPFGGVPFVYRAAVAREFQRWARPQLSQGVRRMTATPHPAPDTHERNRHEQGRCRGADQAA